VHSSFEAPAHSSPFQQTTMQHIALFGTSADPPTAAHQTILVELSDRFHQVAVWASNNPFKPQQTPLHHRTAMLQLLISEIQPPRLNLRVDEGLSDMRALTTVERARQRWQVAEFTFVVGSDLVPQMPRWYRVETLLQQVKLLVVPRSGYTFDQVDLEPLQRLGAEVAIAPFTAPPVSSTAYRQERDSDMITPAIAAYIHDHQLYSTQSNPIAF
jgi:nicotinate-nucleotide adenylyltransferase